MIISKILKSFYIYPIQYKYLIKKGKSTKWKEL